MISLFTPLHVSYEQMEPVILWLAGTLVDVSWGPQDKLVFVYCVLIICYCVCRLQSEFKSFNDVYTLTIFVFCHHYAYVHPCR